MTAQNQIKNIYGFDFPSDFFSFYKFIERINNDEELVGEYNKGLGLLGMYPGKIFDVFNSDFDSENQDLIKEGRYEADPPEFFTVLQGDTDGLHWGYYFDAPSTQNSTAWVASYYARDAFSISANNHTLFEETREQLESLYSGHIYSLSNEKDENELAYCKAQIKLLDKLRIILMEYETKERKEQGREYEQKYREFHKREILVKTRCEMGVVTEKHLFRPTAEKDKFDTWNYHPDEITVHQLHEEAIKSISEGFPANALKIGKDLWIYQEYNRISHDILHSAYTALGRHILRGVLEKYCMPKKIMNDPDFIVALNQAESLEELSLSWKKIAELPIEINRFRNLKLLFLGSNELEYLPDEIAELSKLEYLNLSSNNFIEIPEVVGKLHSLKTLNLSNNAIKELPESFQGLKNLEELHLKDTRLYEFPKVICSLKNLKKLSISRSRFSELPNELNELENLEELEIRVATEHPILSFPKKLDYLKHLKKLRFYSYYDKEYPPFPQAFCDLENLEELEISRFFEYPNEMENLKKITYLKLENYQLTALPKVIFRLKKLKKLYASCCKLEELPDEIIELQALEDIYLHGNKIKKIPNVISQLPHLKKFNIGYNELPRDEVERLKKLLPNVKIVCGNQHV